MAQCEKTICFHEIMNADSLKSARLLAMQVSAIIWRAILRVIEEKLERCACYKGHEVL